MGRGTEGGVAPGRMPVVFAAPGAPVLRDDQAWMAELAPWAEDAWALRRRRPEVLPRSRPRTKRPVQFD